MRAEKNFRESFIPSLSRSFIYHSYINTSLFQSNIAYLNSLVYLRCILSVDDMIEIVHSAIEMRVDFF